MNKYLYAFTLFFVSLFITKSSYASHAQGADLSYQCLGNGQYKITYSFYRDCSGISASTSIPVTITSSCGGSQTLTLAQTGTAIEVSNLCSTASSTCGGGTLPGVQRYTYTATVPLAPGCIYTVGYGECCRNNPYSGDDLYVEAKINTTNGLCNSSPSFTSYPVPYYCINSQYNYSHGTVEPDGDSLVFVLINPLNGSGTPIALTPPSTVTNPLPTNGGFGFNSTTGTMTFTPTTQGFYPIAVRVDEYRNGVLIGSTIRDIQLVVINCNNVPPIVASNITNSNSSGGLVTSANTLGVCPGSTVSFNITAHDPTGQTISFSSNIAANIPGATLVRTPINGRQDSVRFTFTWTPTLSDSGFRYFTITISDGNCPIPGNQLFTYNIFVLKGISAGPDLAYCPVGGPVTVQTGGASQFSWTTLSGGPPVGMISSTPDSSLVTFAPTVTTTYIVKGNLTGGCKDRDTITIRRVADFNSYLTTSRDTVCKNGTAILTSHAYPDTVGPYMYTWTPMASVINVQDSNATVKPLTTTRYTVAITSRDGCLLRKDSVRIIVSGVGPKVDITANKNYICPGDTIQLTPKISALECGLTPGGLGAACPGGSQFAFDTLGTGTATSTVSTPYRNFWHDGRTQYLFKAAELQAQGMQAGTITDLSFYVATKNSTQPFNGFTIKMSCTSLNALTTAGFVTGLQTVASPIAYTTVANSWNTHTFDNPYDWDGYSNLIVEICFDNSSYLGTNDAVRFTSPFAGATLYRQQDAAVGCTLTTPTALAERPNVIFGSCIPPLNGYTYTWTPTTDLTCSNCLNPKVSLKNNTTYKLTVNDGNCTGDTIINLFINPNVKVNAGRDTVSCGQPAQLNVAQINPVAPVCIPNYSLGAIPYAAKTATAPTTVNFTQACSNGAADDRFAGPITLPFNFQFYCNTYSNIYITQNGYVTFSPSTCLGNPQTLPNAATPNNMIALCLANLGVAGTAGGGGTVEYFTTGVAPNRVFTIRFNDVLFLYTTSKLTGEIQLYETTNNVELHTFVQDRTAGNKSQGVENAAGTSAVTVAGRNNVNWTIATPEGRRFTPQYNGSFITNIAWSPAAGLSDSTIANPLATPIGNTCYEAKVSYNDGCVTRDTVCVTLSTFPYTLSLAPDTICGGDTAQIIFTGPGVSYTWTPSAGLSDSTIASPKATAITTTQFNVTAQNADGCVIKDSITVPVYPQPLINLPGDRSICPYDSFEIFPNGGPYDQYEWFSAATGTTIIATTPTIFAKPGNTYSVRVKIAGKACYYYAQNTFTLTPYTLSPISAVGAATICDGDSVILSANPGLTNYQWNNGSTSQFDTIRVSGTYFYTATDANGCNLTSNNAIVQVDANPVIAFNTVKNPICPGDRIVLNAGKETGVTYTWTPGGVSDSLIITTPGLYTVVANRNGCIKTDNITINAATPPMVALPASFDTCSCNFSTVLSPIVTSTSAVSYLWSNGTTATDISTSQTGSFSVSVTDANSCTASASVSVGVYCLNIDATSARPSINLGESILLVTNIVNTNYTPSLTYTWTPDSTLASPSSANTTTKPSVSAVYTIKVIDALHGCTAIDTISIDVIPPGLFANPSAFTPNGDGINDYFYPYFPPGSSATVSALRIYNRWGQLVYTGATAPGWDGKTNGVLAPFDLYTYYLQISVPDATQPSGYKVYNIAGSFELLR